MTKQKKVVVYGRPGMYDFSKEERERMRLKDEVNELLDDGWKVVMGIPFSQSVSIGYGCEAQYHRFEGREPAVYGEYGVVYILEKEFPEEDKDIAVEDDESAFDDE